VLRTLIEKLKVNEFVLGLALEFSFYFKYQDYWIEESMLECGEPHFQHDYLVKRTRASGLVGPTTMGDLGKAHRIHSAVNNLQAENQSTVIKTTGTVANQTLSILINLGATESFISSAALKRIKVKVVEWDEFSFVEMASRSKQNVGGKVTKFTLNLGELSLGSTCTS